MDDWRRWAECVGKGAPLDLFFPRGSTGTWVHQIDEAKRHCGRCLVRPECLQFALDHGEHNGIWGGLTEAERRGKRRPPARIVDPARLSRVQELCAKYAVDCGDGHALWTGSKGTKIDGKTITPRQAMFYATHRRPPEGHVLARCDVPRCIGGAHLTDRSMREAGAVA